jgi:hypothetical protein
MPDRDAIEHIGVQALLGTSAIPIVPIVEYGRRDDAGATKHATNRRVRAVVMSSMRSP